MGVTSDSLVKKLRGPRARLVRPFAERAAAVERLVRPYGAQRVTVVALEDPLAPVERAEFDAIVVSKDTQHTAETINAMRQGRGLPSLKVVVVPLLLAYDGKPISATRILLGEIDEAGKPVQKSTQASRPRKNASPKHGRPTGKKAARKRARGRSEARTGSRAGGPRARR